MDRWLVIIVMSIYLILSPFKALGEEIIKEKRYAIEPIRCAYKTQEEIAWEIVQYAIKNIPSMSFRIKHYENLLEAYRRALNVVKEPKEPIPPVPEKETNLKKGKDET
ncbi:MAG: hypothetical protein ACOYU0_04250 [Nitrospirota bacterium]